MILIRCFLWGLVAVMTLQGFLNADEYGSAASFLGGMGISLSIWGETLGNNMAFWSGPSFVPLPRVIATAALHETARHPGLKMIPQLQATIKIHQATWARFRERGVTAMLAHSDLVGGLMSEPAARALWTPWIDAKERVERELEEARGQTCTVLMWEYAVCSSAEGNVSRLEAELTRVAPVAAEWSRVLAQDSRASASALATLVGVQESNNYTFDAFAVGLAMLHDVTNVDDPRIAALLSLAHNISLFLTSSGGNSWLRRIVYSLLTVEVWTACLDHVRQRESRVRDLMITAGVNEMMHAHERILNESLLTVADADEKLVQDWFGEMGAYAWWLPDEIPPLVRRCVGQEAGDCSRIGPTEITALSVQIGERSKIVEDWTRRIFIGMWNAMPAIVLLFGMELVIICIPKRLGLQQPVQIQSPLQSPVQPPPMLGYHTRSRARERSRARSQNPLLLRNV